MSVIVVIGCHCLLVIRVGHSLGFVMTVFFPVVYCWCAPRWGDGQVRGAYRADFCCANSREFVLGAISRGRLGIDWFSLLFFETLLAGGYVGAVSLMTLCVGADTGGTSIGSMVVVGVCTVLWYGFSCLRTCSP